MVPIVLIQIDLRHDALIITIEHDGYTREQVDSRIHSLWLLELQHSVLVVAAEKVILPFPRGWVVDIIGLFFCG